MPDLIPKICSILKSNLTLNLTTFLDIDYSIIANEYVSLCVHFYVDASRKVFIVLNERNVSLIWHVTSKKEITTYKFCLLFPNDSRKVEVGLLPIELVGLLVQDMKHPLDPHETLKCLIYNPNWKCGRWGPPAWGPRSIAPAVVTAQD